MYSADNIVLDTNCLVQIISRRNRYYRLWELFLDGGYCLSVTNEIMQEYEEILSIKTSPTFARMICEIILRAPNTIKLDVHYRWWLITSDPDDNKFVDCAIMANAKYIVSEDAHFKVLSTIEFPRVNVVRLDEFDRLMIP